MVTFSQGQTQKGTVEFKFRITLFLKEIQVGEIWSIWKRIIVRGEMSFFHTLDLDGSPLDVPNICEEFIGSSKVTIGELQAA